MTASRVHGRPRQDRVNDCHSDITGAARHVPRTDPAVKSLEAVSTISSVALSPEIGGDKAPCAGNGGSIFKHGNAVSADFRASPPGRGHFCARRRYSSLS